MPTAVAVAGLAVSAVGTGVKAYGLHKATEAQNNTNEYNAQVALKNAGYAREQAGYLDEQADYLSGQADEAIKTGAKEEKIFRSKVNVLMGSQNAYAGNSGAVAGEGSYKMVALDTLKHGEEDAMTIRYNAAKQAEGINRQATATRRDAKKYRDMAADYTTNSNMLRANRTSSTLPVLGTVLDGTSNMALTASKINW